ncbi:MAG: Hsp33 family molecular chaperone HslO [Pseudomonadales bacterium]
MSDSLHRFQLENLHVRGEWLSLSNSWQDIQNTADYPPAVKQVLGEALVAIGLLADSLKFDGSLVLQIHGTAPVSMLVVQATSEGSIRGMANWEGDIANNASFKDLFQPATRENSEASQAIMAISVEPNSTRSERYQSLVPLEGKSLMECLTHYFAQSEQLNTRLWLAVDDKTAAGLMLQSLPSEETEQSERSQLDGWEHACILADTIKNQELLELPSQDLLHRLYHEEDLRIYDAKRVRFDCSCSHEKVERAIRSIGEEAAESILVEQGNISTSCDFCNTNYVLDRIDVARLFSSAAVNVSKAPDAGSVH